MKELIINGKVYAKYQVEGMTLYYKMIILIYEYSKVESEEMIIKIIQSVENREFLNVGYLNV